MSWRETHGVVRVWVFTNGMVMCVDKHGQQVPAYQGRLNEVEAAIRADFPAAEWLGPVDFGAAQRRVFGVV